MLAAPWWFSVHPAAKVPVHLAPLARNPSSALEYRLRGMAKNRGVRNQPLPWDVNPAGYLGPLQRFARRSDAERMN